MFRGTKRFELIRKLGEGGMGLVYEAHDNERDMRVALKTLRELDASSLYRFKREFRALTDVSHPNIIGLYDLVSEGNDWFFTMELVDGVDFVTYVRPNGWKAPAAAPLMGATQPTSEVKRSEPRARVATPNGAGGNGQRAALGALIDLDRLRAVLGQLAEALHALHAAGMVHRDLKPSNVRVTPKGRVVLMDFGIAAEASVLGDRHEGTVSGTPAFMAPEQAAGDAPGAAADWYSLGVILYVALTGKLPFTGVPEMMLMAKQANDAPSPSQLTSGIPEDLESLCRALLSRKPEQRPIGGEVLALLGRGDEHAFHHTESPESSRSVFVGRESELERLRDAFAATRAGRTACVLIRGASGLGKSTLMRRFLHEIETDNALPVILKGRCHERESLPYKAWDGVIDSLSHMLLGMAADRVASLLPEEVDLLPRLFPVLRRVPGIQRARPIGPSDPQELRTHAFAALSELLWRLAQHRPLLVYIDDLQWADRDSLQLLVEMMRDPEAPRMLFIGALRAENLAADPVLGEALAQVTSRHRADQIDLQPLSRSEQRALVARMLGTEPGSPRLEDPFWEESAGSPLFLSELVRWAREHGGDLPDTTQRPSLEDVLAARIAHLPDAARRLLDVVAASGEPTPLWVLGDAAGLSGDERERALAMLRVANLARVARHAREPWLVAYHDRVRETLAARTEPDKLRVLHRHLAEVLERWEDATVDSLARHWLAAGDRSQAATYLVKAARGAADKLAFERAAELYRAALEHGPHPIADARELRRHRGEALSLAGRCFDAAGEFRQAADGAEPDVANDLLRLAADNLLRGGHIELGLLALRDVMKGLGMRVAETRGKALASLLVQRSRIALRGLKFKPKRRNEVSRADLSRLDTLYAASTTLGMIDHLRGADMQTRHLLTALKLGEERTACRALAIEAVFRSAAGGRFARSAEVLSQEVELRARKLGDPALLGIAHLAVGASAMFSGRYRASAAAFGEAERVFTAECVGVEWERVTARYFLCSARLQLGDFDDAAKATKQFVDEAERRNDNYARNLFKTQPSTWRSLQLDEPDQAREALATALAGWPPGTFYTAHYFELIARTIVLLYSGETRAALELLEGALPSLKRSMLVKLPWVIAEYQRWAMAAAFAEGRTDQVLRLCKQLDKLRAPVGDGFCNLFRAAVAHRAGDSERGQQLLTVAVRNFDQADTTHLAVGTRYRLGQTLGGSEGARLSTEAIAWMHGQHVKNPERMIDLLVPRVG
jgi:eukaryotic-like serine/threonine-protein kinase